MKFKIKNKYEGFYFRRFIHYSIALIPFIYYWYGPLLNHNFRITSNEIVSLIVFLVMFFEIMRLKFKWRIYGQRPYEQKRISAVMWTVLGIGIVLLQAPKIGVHGAAISAPIIWSLAFGDPALGDARLYHAHPKLVIAIGILVVGLIWILSAIWLHTPWLLVPILIPVCVFAESINSSHIDDNATMLLIPLAAIFLLSPFFISF